MKLPPSSAVGALLLLLAPAVAMAQVNDPAPSGQPPSADELSLQELLNTAVVSSASKFRQEVREAPASITVVTAEDIRRQGHRTLADVLRSVRGFYTTDDRNYTYLGLRGFARPGDYNSRVLLLIDGHRLNDAVYDMAPFGTDFPLDVSLIDRVEVIRGPGSSLYGTSAFFAVINVVTQTAAARSGVHVDAHAGSLGTTGATLSYGGVFGTRELLIATSAQRSSGDRRIEFPEFQDIGSGMSEAVGLDHDESVSAFGSLAVGAVSVRAGFGNRQKQVPTASFDVVFGDDRYTTRDTRAYVNASYDGPLGQGWDGTARVAYDYYTYQGVYPFDYGLPDLVLSIDDADSRTVTAELNVRRRIAGVHLLTFGTEVRHQFRSRMTNSDITGTVLDINHPGTVSGVYAQDEMRLRPWLLINAGIRLDRHPSFGNYAAPRVGLVLMPRRSTAIKLLHGRAFRAPNPYERFYYNERLSEEAPALSPEKNSSTELVWEESFSNRVRTSISVFGYRASDIIELGSTAEGALLFANVGDVESRGVEGEVEARLPRGISVRASHAAVRTRHRATGATASNSPRHVSKVAAQVPIARATIAFEGNFSGERMTIAGQPLRAYFLSNINLGYRLSRSVEVAAGVYNLFDVRYGHPGAEEHRQQSIPQSGRTAMARLRVGL
jgi:iron complex outermembrane receptor protein